ncbi:MAG: alpha/beta fold hydrolase [Rhodospirillales bacterium]|nr:alpha/beta fold hydrolase [Rhodospirillales bacterium]
MFVKQYGSGARTFFCLHGWGGDHREFVPLASRLPGDACLLSVDLPGYGESPKPTRWELDAIVDEICASPGIRGAELVTLVGFCSGAIFALLVAAREPALVRRIVMIDPFAFIPWYFRIFLAGEFGRRAYHTTFQTRMGRAITDWVLKRMQTTDADFTRAFTTLDHEVTLRYLQLLATIDLHKQFEGLSMAIDIIHGEHTFDAVRRSVEIYHKLWPHSQVIILNGVGHLPMIKGARQLSEIIFVPQSIHL